jgi:muconate cycloisomerase
MAEVKRSVGVPIVADESAFDLPQAHSLAAAGAADVFSIYAGKGGGIEGARKMAVAAEAAGLECTVGSNLELGIASAAMIHLAISTPAVHPKRVPCDIIGPLYYGFDMLTPPLPIREGFAYPLEGPGLGVELDDEMVERFRVTE